MFTNVKDKLDFVYKIKRLETGLECENTNSDKDGMLIRGEDEKMKVCNQNFSKGEGKVRKKILLHCLGASTEQEHFL